MAVGTRPDGGRFDVKRSHDFQTSENIPDRNQDKSPWDAIQTARGEKIETLQTRNMMTTAVLLHEVVTWMAISPEMRIPSELS